MKKTVLIVDDSFINRTYLRLLLEEMKFETFEAGNGVEAFVVIEKQPIDLILLDLMMPIMNGIETLENLIKKEIKIPVIIISADVEPITIKKCKELGYPYFIKKPFTAFEVEDIVKEVFKDK